MSCAALQVASSLSLRPRHKIVMTTNSSCFRKRWVQRSVLGPEVTLGFEDGWSWVRRGVLCWGPQSRFHLRWRLRRRTSASGRSLRPHRRSL